MMKVSGGRFGKCAQRVTGRITVLWLRGNLEKKPWSKAVISLRQREIYAWNSLLPMLQFKGSLFSRTLLHSVRPYCSSLKRNSSLKRKLSSFTHPLVVPNQLTFFFSFVEEKSWCEQWNTETRRHNKRSLSNSHAIFQVFWSHTMV